ASRRRSYFQFSARMRPRLAGVSHSEGCWRFAAHEERRPRRSKERCCLEFRACITTAGLTNAIVSPQEKRVPITESATGSDQTRNRKTLLPQFLGAVNDKLLKGVLSFDITSGDLWPGLAS
ncbi:hypothetical protein, partial [Haloferula sp.]|uniref:hypothetical protein n=1 Tax=Haloferula sp. TaxID=2497595 RepID=UPI003C70BB84